MSAIKDIKDATGQFCYQIIRDNVTKDGFRVKKIIKFYPNLDVLMGTNAFQIFQADDNIYRTSDGLRFSGEGFGIDVVDLAKEKDSLKEYKIENGYITA